MSNIKPKTPDKSKSPASGLNDGDIKQIVANKRFIIAFAGPKGSGKTTACRYINDAYVTNNQSLVSFASALKGICSDLFSLSDEQIYGTQKETQLPRPIEFHPRHLTAIVKLMAHSLDSSKFKHKFNRLSVAQNKFNGLFGRLMHTPREVMQFVGTEIMHAVYEPFHCDLLMSKILKNNISLVDDLRFVSELDYLIKGGVPMRTMVIVGRNEQKRGKEEHSSESDWKNINPDYRIDNSGSLDEFKKNVVGTFRTVIGDIYDELQSSNPVGTILNDETTNQSSVRVGKFGFSKAT